MPFEMNLLPIIFKGGFSYPQSTPFRSYDTGKVIRRNGMWTPKSFEKLAARIVYYTATGKQLR